MIAYRSDVGSAPTTARDQLDELNRQWPFSAVGGVIVSAMVAWVLWDDVSTAAMAWWLVAIYGTSGARLALWYMLKYRGSWRDSVRKALVVFTALAAVQAAAWGSAGVIFFAPDAPYQSFLVIVLLGGAATNQSLLNAYAPAAWIGVALMVLPLASMMIRTGDEFLLPLGILSVLFVGTLFSLTKRSNETLVSNMRLRRALSEELVRRDQVERVLRESESRQAKAAQELATAKDRAEAAARAKSQFLANMSHEIRTPLNGVLGMADLLARSELTASQSRHVEIIRNSGRTLMAVINDILDVTKIEVGKVNLETVPFDPRGAVNDVVDLFSETASARSVALSFSFSEDLPATVEGDPNRLRQVLGNLVSNAIKFTPGGGRVEIRTSSTAESGDRATLTFEIEDTGVGIEGSQLERLFEPFEQADSSTSRRYGGTGLGLTIVAGLAEVMGGEISARSVLGKGSTFTFSVTMPIVTEHAQAARTRPSDDDAHADVRFDAKVLLAEDNVVNQEVAREALAQFGCDVVVANDGLEALAAWRADRFDLVLMDCQMPALDGFDATAMIRTQERQGEAAGRTPIVALTAHVLEEDRQRCFAAGMDDFLSKPFDRASLQEILYQWLPQPSETESERQARAAASHLSPGSRPD